MSTTPQLSPPPAAGNDTAPQVTGAGDGGGMDRFRNLISKMSGGGTPLIDQRLQQHHDQRIANASLNQKAYQDLSSTLTRDSDKKYHDDKIDDPNNPNKLTPEGLKLEAQRQAAFQAWSKAAGVDKESKSVIQKMGQLADHLVHHRTAGGQQPGAAGAPPAAGGAASPSLRPPPGKGEGGDALPPPPSASASPAPGGGGAGSPATTFQPDPATLNESSLHSREEQDRDAASKRKITEEQAKTDPKAMVDGLIKAGFPREEAMRITSTKLAGAAGRPKIKEEMVPDPDSKTGYSKSFVDELTGQEVSRVKDVAPTRSLITSETDTTNPETNQTTRTVRRPIFPGAGGASPNKVVTASTATASSPASAHGSKSAISKLSPPVDADGHITTAPGASPQVLEGANQLLDGTDKEKLPTKTRELSAALARRAGWEQGKFTPKEQVQLREATTYLQKAASDPSLAALDASFSDRMQLAQVISNPDAQGFIGRGLSTAAAQNMDPKQVAFVQMYNQLVGTIAGLSSLVRSGRATEATIERLKSELPNPTTTKDSADGRQRIQRLLSEIDVAMDKGSFGGTGTKSASKLSPPPSAAQRGTGTKDDPIIIAP